MPIDYEHLMSLRTRGERVQYTDRDTLLYALGAGLGGDPADRNEQPFLDYPSGLKTLPTFASILVGNRLLDDCGWDAAQVEARDEVVTLERPLEESGSLLVDSDVAAVLDKGAGEGALITVESRARRERDGQPQFSVRRTWLARGDGGFGGRQGRGEGGSASSVPVPTRLPDMTHTCVTRPDQAHLFRILLARGAQNRVPPVRRQGGAELVLDGLCLQAVACQAILAVICEYDHTLIRSFACRLAGGVAYAGETLVAELWQDANIVSCRLRVRDRDVVVLDQGRCALAT